MKHLQVLAYSDNYPYFIGFATYKKSFVIKYKVKSQNIYRENDILTLKRDNESLLKRMLKTHLDLDYINLQSFYIKSTVDIYTVTDEKTKQELGSEYVQTLYFNKDFLDENLVLKLKQFCTNLNKTPELWNQN